MKKIDFLDELISFYEKHMPNKVCLMKNPERYREVEKAINKISDFVLSVDGNAKISAKPDELTGTSLCLEITADLIVVDAIDKFCDAISKADAFEFLPLRNGKVFFGLTFEDTWMPVPPLKEE